MDWHACQGCSARSHGVGRMSTPVTHVRQRHLITLALAVAIGALSGMAVAQTYPSRPIRMVVGFPAGGTIDGLARTLANQLESQLGRTIVIDNRSGANGMIGGEIVARATGDGYTLLFSPPALIINQILGKAPYVVLKDLLPVANIGLGEGSLVVVHPAVPVKTVQELIALAKAKPLTYGTPGIGNTQHLATEMFNMQASIK